MGMRIYVFVALAAVPIGVAAGACTHRVFECRSADNCISRGMQGICQDSGFCSYPDDGCATGQRYDEFAGDGLAEQCVPEPEDTTTGGDGSSSSDDGSPCVVSDCVDADGDGYGIGAECLGPDCDDDNAAHHDRCVYVGPAGNDDSGDGTVAAPWRTIDRGIAALDPGMSLVLLDGLYDATTNGTLHIDCAEGGNARNGTEAQPISVRAATERAVEIVGEGGAGAIQIEECEWWRVHGVYGRGDDLSASQGGLPGSVASIRDSRDIVLRRLLLSHNNRFYNTDLLSIAASTDVLVEESEAYHFQGAAFMTWSGSTRVTFRRCYANSRDHADLEGCDTSQDGATPWCSQTPDGGDQAFAIYQNAADVAFENCIADGRHGVGIAAQGGNIPNVTVRGAIITGDPGYGILVEAGDAGVGAEGTTIEDTLVTQSIWAAVRLRSTTAARVSGLSLLDGGVGLWVDEDEVALCAGLPSGCDVTVDRVHAQGHAETGFRIGAEVEWSLDSCNAYGNAQDWPAEEDIGDSEGNIRSSLSVDGGIGVGAGECAAYPPATSPLAGAGADGQDIGAAILWRIEGDTTEQPLWDPQTGAFPCGAVVSGLSDDAATSCTGIHERLNVFTESCPAPPGYAAPPVCDGTSG